MVGPHRPSQGTNGDADRDRDHEGPPSRRRGGGLDARRPGTGRGLGRMSDIAPAERRPSRSPPDRLSGPGGGSRGTRLPGQASNRLPGRRGQRGPSRGLVGLSGNHHCWQAADARRSDRVRGGRPRSIRLDRATPRRGRDRARPAPAGPVPLLRAGRRRRGAPQRHRRSVIHRRGATGGSAAPVLRARAVTASSARESGENISSAELLTRQRWIEIARIILTGLLILLHGLDVLPIWWLYGAVAVGLYPLVKKGLVALFQERRLGTEIFVTLATLIALLGGEEVAGAVLMVIILVAEFIADLNTDRARASIRGLIGSVPRTAIVRDGGGERSVAIDQIQVGDVVLVRAGDKVPVDGRIVSGGATVNEAPITGESVPKDKNEGDDVFAGTVMESGAADVRTEKVGADTTFARIIKLVEEAGESQAPVQKLADRVAAWLIPVVLLFLVVVFLATRDLRLIVTLLIFTSPAELGLATPMVMIAAIARAAHSGVLVKGGVYLEALAKIDAMVFDKTGT